MNEEEKLPPTPIEELKDTKFNSNIGHEYLGLFNDCRLYRVTNDPEYYLLKDYMHVDVNYAKFWARIDPTELLVHINYEDRKYGGDLKYPEVWRIDAWRQCESRLKKEKKISELGRHYTHLRNEKLVELTNAIQKELGFDKATCTTMAYSMMVSMSAGKIKLLYDVDLSNIPEEVRKTEILGLSKFLSAIVDEAERKSAK